MKQEPSLKPSDRRRKLALISVGVVTLVSTLILEAGTSSGQAGPRPAAPGSAQPATRVGLKNMQKAPVVALHTMTTAKRTPMTFRLVVTIESSGQGGASTGTKVMDAVFNEEGLLVQADTRDAHLASIYKQAETTGGDGYSALACRDRCRHHLDDGNAPKYGVCWWACFVELGSSPKRPGVGHVPGDLPVHQ